MEVRRWLKLFIIRASGKTFLLVRLTFIYKLFLYLILERPGILKEHFSYIQGLCSNIWQDIRIA
jgi:hypothetical protein